MPISPDPTENYLPALMAGDLTALLAGFAAEPQVDEPLTGPVTGAQPYARYVAERRAWFAEHGAQLEPIRTTRNSQRTVFESLLHLQVSGKAEELPVAVVGVHASGGKLSAVRVYHSLWPLIGGHRVRPALLVRDPAVHETDIVADYQHALDSGDIEAIVNTFDPDGYFREPAGGPWIYRGHAKLREFMGELLAHGGIGLEHCTVTDDGVACALEFNAVKFGTQPLVPQAGVAVYERGPSGKLHAARIYDDVNVEALAKGGVG
jgi:hypothetical protein